MAKVTAEQEALYALQWDLPRGDLPVAAQLEYDRLKLGWGERKAVEARARAAKVQAREEKIGAEVRARLQAGPAAITIVSWTIRAGAILLLLGGWAIAVFKRPPWAIHGPALIVYLAIVALVSILLLYRVWRMRVRFDDRGIAVCQLLRTCHFGWPEVSHFADGNVLGLSPNEGEVEDPQWALRIVLRDGRSVTVGATAGIWSGSAGPKKLATVRYVAERHAVPARLTGKPSGGYSRRPPPTSPHQPTKPPSTGP
jgi:hypothetical protein